MTTVLTLLIAIPMAIVVVRTKLPGGRLFAMAMQWPFFISSLILGFGWILMCGPGRLRERPVPPDLRRGPVEPVLHPRHGPDRGGGPRPDRLRVLRQRPAAVRRRPRVGGPVCGAGPLRIVTQVIVPMLRPPVVYSSILVFSMSVETLSVPLLYGQPVNIDVFSTFLYRNGLQSIDPDYSVLGAASVVILCVTISLVAIQAKLLKDAQRFVSVQGKATRPRPLDLGWLKWVNISRSRSTWSSARSSRSPAWSSGRSR